MFDHEQIFGIRVSLASPEQIRGWSSGEVTEAVTINYRTHKPERNGLFCEHIFGPTKDWTCFCGKYTRAREAEGQICEKCGVEITPSRVRRERMGHIELAVPVAHTWFTRGAPSVLSLLLDLSKRQIHAVLSYTGYLVTNIHEDIRRSLLAHLMAGDEGEQSIRLLLESLTIGAYLEDGDYRRLSCLSSNSFRADTGAQALRARLLQLDLRALSDQLREDIHVGKGVQKKVLKRLHVVEAFLRSGVRPEWMVLSVLPVLPPDLRPLLVMEGGRLASADANVLYERVLHRNKRIRQFQQLNAPSAILNHEKRMLQAAVDVLLDNAHTYRPVTNANRQKLKSLTDTLAGKYGRFRRNLLGKRVDYSGRSVIVGNAQLQLHQCGLPKKMACELFKPFLIRKLLDRMYARSAKHAKRMVEQRDPLIWDLLAECLYERVVLLNRAPTLHRLSIQAFEPVLIEGSALHLHPLVCSSFNADFDGDQMAVHLPLSEAAQREARNLLLSTQNLRSAATGDPSLSISQEMVLGLYYLTEDRPSPKKAGQVFADTDDALQAYDHSLIDLHTRIVIRCKEEVVYCAPPPTEAQKGPKYLETTAGRLLFNEALPGGMRYKNYAMTKELLKRLITESLSHYGGPTTVQLAETLKKLGFQFATKSGISFATSDMQMPPEREALIQQGQAHHQETDILYRNGEITYDEWYRLIIALWSEVTEQVSEQVKNALDAHGSLMTIVKSGATKAKFQQIRQLSGMRGLLVSPSGRIIPFPVFSNYKLGQAAWEVFVAASGARKGFMDRSLNTAMSGYLTRKLVEVGMSVWVTMADCGTTRGVYVSNEQCRHQGLSDMRPMIIGRVLAEPIAGMGRETLLDEVIAEHLHAQSLEGVWIRSPLTCEATHGVCQQCYGRDLATGRMVRRGVAVGVIAGQSIGEPGTQLTMRTFHSGGIANAQGDITQGLPRVSELFETRTPKKKAILSELAGHVSVQRDEQSKLAHVRVTASASFLDEYYLPVVGTTILVADQEYVQGGHLLARLHTQERGREEVRARYAGRLSRRENTLLLSVEEVEERAYDIPLSQQLTVEEATMVEIGTPLTAGAIDPKELLALCGVEATQRYLVAEVQRIYRNTGVYISDKHPETIVRQMLRYLVVRDEGDSDLLPGEQVDQSTYEQVNAAVLAQGGQPALARPLVLGLTRAALATSSWIAAASFQETSRILMQAAIQKKTDPLLGLKEKIVIGLRIPTPEQEQCM